MREIKFLGTYKKDGTSRSYQYSLFECPECEKQVEKARKDGIKQKYCSHKCYAKNRNRRGSYKLEGYVMISGYKYILKPDHPHATKKGYVAEHRLVAEKKLGRYLEKYEDVHHINFKKIDNSPENLSVLTSSEHSKLHARLKPINKRSKQYEKAI